MKISEFISKTLAFCTSRTNGSLEMICGQLRTLNQSSHFCFSPAVLRILRRGAEVKNSDGPESVGGRLTSVSQPAKNGTHARELQWTLHLPFERSSQSITFRHHIFLPCRILSSSLMLVHVSCRPWRQDDGEVTGYEVRARPQSTRENHSSG
jgi:hypothetical protein